MTFRRKARFHTYFSTIFRDTNYHITPGNWTIFFAGKRIVLPLHDDRRWLDWDHALAILGHDIDIKETYENLILSDKPPTLFIDIGANYGTHSVLFLSHEIHALTFEPNSSCHTCFLEFCELNRLAPNLQHIALGDHKSETVIKYPAYDTWLGSTDPLVQEKLAREKVLVEEVVEQKLLDEYLPEIANLDVLIKIDTEGSEAMILRGAENILATCSPKVIFECWKDGDRAGIYAILNGHGFKIYELPWNEEVDSAQTGLLYHNFLNSSGANFIALKA
jgi:FkbM family methyltransferase